jgi:spermidine synthase
VTQERWISETLFADQGLRTSFAVNRILFETQTDHQHLVLFENPLFGKMLMLDGATQVTTRDEFIYHEMMTHVPILAHGEAREVLIVGGGDCGIAEEVLKHRDVARLTQVEIDASVVEFAKQHFPEFTEPVLSDPRFDLIIDDGMNFVTRTDRRFEVIIVDSTDPHGPGAVLFTAAFYAACKRCMASRAVMVTQNGVPFLQATELETSLGHLRKLFSDVSCYVAAIPTYVGGHMAMGWAASDPKLRGIAVEILRARHAAAAGFSTKYWTPEVQCAAFALPRFIAEIVERAKQT